MKILYDYQIFSSQKFGGVSRYFYEIMKGVDSNINLLLNQNSYFKEKGILIDKNFKKKNKLFNIINQLYTKLYFKYNSKYDIFHPTYYNPYFIDYVKKPFVLTIHDMIHEKFVDFFHENDTTSDRKKLLAMRADRIIAVSERTKLDIIEILNVPANKIDVVYHGSDFNLIEEDKSFSKRLPEKYILFTGNRNHYKNFINFIKAIYKFLNKDKTLFVICAGGGKFNKNELHSFENHDLTEQILQFSCNDAQLKSLYNNALFFIFPSLYEGFGIPLIEAMACGTAILCSDASCFPEIVQDSALLFNPYLVEDIENKINFALTNDLAFFQERGKERFQDFSWDKTRVETIQVYKKVFDE